MDGSPRMTSRSLTVCLAVCLAAVTMAVGGCTRAQDEGEPEFTALRASGSGTCLPLLRILSAGQPDKATRLIFLPGLHSAGGVKGVSRGSLDIGAISRELTPEEASQEITTTWLSSDGLVMAVHPSVSDLGVTGLTSEQVRGIYSGAITDWSQVGASTSRPIVVIDRHEGESAKIALRKYVLGPEARTKVTSSAIAVYYESDMVDSVRTTAGAIGYFSLGYAISQKVPVTRLRLDGVEPSVASVEAGRYTLVRPLGVVTRSDPPDPVAVFLQWATSEQARAIMTVNGYAPYRDDR
jgi:phosphate transport system substrate-binding protein